MKQATLRNNAATPLTSVCCLLLGLLLLFGESAFASAPPAYFIETPDDSARITIYAEYFADKNGTISFADIASGQLDDRFQPAYHGTERLGIHGHPFWLRLAIRNNTGKPISRILELVPGFAAELAFYQPTETGYSKKLSGTNMSPPWADIKSRFQLFRLDLPAGATELYFIRLVPTLGFGFSLHLYDPSELGDRQTSADQPYYILGGIVIGLSLIMLALFHYTREQLFIEYFLFQLCALIAIAASGGFLGILWFALPGLQPRAETFFELLTIAAAAAFSRSYLDSCRHMPTADLLLRLTLWVFPALALLSLAMPIHVAGMLAYSTALISSLVFAIIGLRAVQLALPRSGLYLLARGVLLLAVVLSVMAAFSWLTIDMPLPLLLLLALTIEAILFAGALIHYREQSLSRAMDTQQRNMMEAAVWQTRNDTLARVNHEIRTPMSGILGMAELLEDTPLTPNQQECVRSIQSAGANLLHIINNVLEHSQIEQGGSDPNIDPFDPGELLMGVLDLFRERAEEKHIELICHIHNNIPRQVSGDSSRLRQILTSLLAACVRHGSVGELVIDLGRDPAGRSDHLRIDFEGSSLRHLHDEFAAYAGAAIQPQQTDASALGLSIARQLCEVIGASCGVGKSRQHGTVLWISAPLPATPDDLEDIQKQTSNLGGRHMLIVDDSSTVTRVIRHQAMSWGMRVMVCHDPREALAAIRMQVSLQDPFDIILLDQVMPGMSGMQLATRIHEDLMISHPLVLVMMTGLQDAPNATLARNVGIHRVLHKPLSGRRLRKTLGDVIDLLTPDPGDNTDHPPPDPSLRILVAEDHLLSQKVIRGMLGKLGLNADMVNNGREALDAHEENAYDLILMDCEMPKMDGFEASRRIRAREQRLQLEPTPIIALTAHVLREHRERSFAAGMNAHVPKPIELNHLAEVIVRVSRQLDDNAPVPDQTSDETPG